jgi:hypothetical protein
MVNRRPGRRTWRGAATLLVGGLLATGLIAAAIHAAPTLWQLTAPADPLGALVAEAERELADRRPPEPVAADGARGLTGVVSRVPVRATVPRASAFGDAGRPPFARVGARMSVAVPPSTPTPPDEAAISGEVEPAFTVETVRGQTVYRMNGDLVLDPGQHREEMVEAGYEYRFGKRGLEKVKLWEVRR